MKKVFWLCVCMGITAFTGSAQYLYEGMIDSEKKAHEQSRSGGSSRALNNYDLKYHRLDWKVNPMMNYIEGNVTSYFVPSASITQIEFDMSGVLSLDSVFYHGAMVPASQMPNHLVQVDFPASIAGGTVDSVTIYYHGNPSSSGFGSFATSTHDGAPVLWTLSQPYGAKDWWPCKEDLLDKIDSVDIYITNPAIYNAASNGILVSETIAGAQRISHYKHRFPIAAYLLGIAVSNYAVYTQEVPFGATVTTIVNHVYPEDSIHTVPATAVCIEQMQLFDSLFGLYPFHTEKYGHTEIGWGGGIEHQTNSFMGNFHYELVAHELAHQWFGDYVTCGSWHDIWLNEGFATYLTGLCYEHLGPEPIYWKPFKKAMVNAITAQPGGSVYCPDTLNVSRVFDTRLTYRKGCMVLHSLRWVMGDTAFYAGLRDYLHDPALAFGFSRLSQFKAKMETACGQDLTWYFDDWYYGEGHPTYNIDWETDENNVITVTIGQMQSHASVDFFEMPLPLYLKNATQDTTIVVNHTMNGQVFTLEPGFKPDSLLFDPEYWIISAANTVSGQHESLSPHVLDIYPTLTTANLFVSLEKLSPNSEVRIVTAEGKQVLQKTISSLLTNIDVSGFSKGMYIISLTSDTEKITRRFVKQ